MVTKSLNGGEGREQLPWTKETNQLEGVGEEEGWVRVEPHRKRATWTSNTILRTWMDEMCYRCLALGHLAKSVKTSFSAINAEEQVIAMGLCNG